MAEADVERIRREYPNLKQRLHWDTRTISYCQADSDGDCDWEGCPQKQERQSHGPIDITRDDPPSPQPDSTEQGG
jgi:hypothetical protein